MEADDLFHLGTVYVAEGEIVYQVSESVDIDVLAQEFSPLRTYAFQVFYWIG
jgi:hypothetical protein